MVLKTEKYICSFDIEMYLVGSWFSTEKSIYINRAIALFINGKINQMHTYSIYQLLFNWGFCQKSPQHKIDQQ